MGGFSSVSSIHNDLLHKGSAKRDIALGVAGLNASAKVPDANLESPVATHAALTTTHGGVLQTSAMKNVASGIAGLDAATKLAGAQIPDISATYGKITTTGTYTGDNTQNRSISHGLGVKPKVVLIVSSTAGSYMFISGMSSASRLADATVVTVNTMDTNFFYVGDVASYQMNQNGITYVWAAML